MSKRDKRFFASLYWAPGLNIQLAYIHKAAADDILTFWLDAMKVIWIQVEPRRLIAKSAERKFYPDKVHQWNTTQTLDEGRKTEMASCQSLFLR